MQYRLSESATYTIHDWVPHPNWPLYYGLINVIDGDFYDSIVMTAPREASKAEREAIEGFYLHEVLPERYMGTLKGLEVN